MPSRLKATFFGYLLHNSPRSRRSIVYHSCLYLQRPDLARRRMAVNSARHSAFPVLPLRIRSRMDITASTVRRMSETMRKRMSIPPKQSLPGLR